MKQEVEIWKPVKDYENLYEVSNHGRVRSLNYGRTGKIRELRPISNGYGYLEVILSKNGNNKHLKIHRLVGQAFLDNPENLPVINHKDEDKTNNHVSNLEWSSYLYNNVYSNVCWTPRPVLQFTKEGILVAEYESVIEAFRKTGINQGNISSCCSGRYGYKSAGGFIWKYKQI